MGSSWVNAGLSVERRKSFEKGEIVPFLQVFSGIKKVNFYINCFFNPLPLLQFGLSPRKLPKIGLPSIFHFSLFFRAQGHAICLISPNNGTFSINFKILKKIFFQILLQFRIDFFTSCGIAYFLIVLL